MALATRTPDSQSEDNNPGQDEFDKLIDRNFSAGDEKMMEERAKDGAIDDNTAGSDELSKLGGPDQVGRGHVDPGPQKQGWVRKNIIGRKGVRGAGIGGLIIAAIIFIISIVQGPLQFIHFAQLLQRFHFASQQDQGNERLSRIARFIRTKDIRDTRVGYLGGKYAQRIETKMNASGIKSAYTDGLKYYDGFVIDPEHPDYKGKSPQEIINQFKNDNHVDVKFGKDVPGWGGKPTDLVISAKDLGIFKGNFTQQKIIRFQLQQAGYSKLSSAIIARVMGKYGGVNWHPMSRLDAKVNQTLLAFYNKLRGKVNEQYKNGSAPTGEPNVKDPEAINPKKDSPAVQQEKLKQQKYANDAKSGVNSTKSGSQTVSAQVNRGDSSPLKAFTSSTSAKLLGGTAAGIGVACMVYSIDHNAGQIKYAQVVLPLMRIGMQMVTLGNQVMNGQEVDLNQLGFYAKSFYDPSSKTSWTQAQSIQANIGQPVTGPSLKQVDSNLNSSVNSIGTPGTPFSFIRNVPGLSDVCSPAGSAIIGVFGITLGILSSGIFTTLSSVVTSAVLAAKATDEIAHWLAGEAVDPNVAGAALGYAADVGTLLAANNQAASEGGRQLKPAESNQLQAFVNQDSQAEFDSHSIAYKLFDPYDQRSAISRLLDQATPSFSQNTNKIASSLLNIGHIFSALPRLFTSSARAAATQPYAYPFPTYGFSVDEMNSSVVNNPFDNANAAATILSGSNGPKYIAQAKACFGANISQIADPDNAGKMIWDVVAGDPGGINGVSDKNIYADNYPSNCASDKSTQWLQIRMFIFDSQVMKASACYEGDPQSCTELGFDQASASTSTSTTSTSTGTPGACPSLNYNKYQPNATECKWIAYIYQNVLPLLPNDGPDGKAGRAARVTWWALREQILDQEKPATVENAVGYSNCADTGPNHDVNFLYDCTVLEWQVGIAGVHVGGQSLSTTDIDARLAEVEAKAKELHPGESLDQILGQVATDAGYSQGTPEYTAAVNSTGHLRISLILRDPATGFFFEDQAVLDECVNGTGCTGNSYTPAKQLAPDHATVLQVIRELTAYFNATSSSTTVGSTACAPGTQDMGKFVGYENGQKTPITLCAVNDLTVVQNPKDANDHDSSESIPNTQYYINGANNRALVNADISAKVVELVGAAKAAGIDIKALSSFRTMKHQTSSCGTVSGSGANATCSNGGYAPPGYSRHQMGRAIDYLDTNYNHRANCRYIGSKCVAPDSPAWLWLDKNAASFGFKQNLTESWHWSPDGQ